MSLTLQDSRLLRATSRGSIGNAIKTSADPSRVENPQPFFSTCKRSVTPRNWGMPPKNNYYSEVILNDPTLTVDNPVSGHEIQVIVGSPSKVAKGTLIEFAKELTEHIRGNQRWSGVHVTVEPIELQDLPPLGEPRHIEGDLTAWILE